MPPSSDNTRPNGSAREQVDKVTGEVVDPTASSRTTTNALVRAEVDIQIATAKQFPRDLERVMDEARSTALINPDVAASCCYAVEKGGKLARGPSIRLAEIFLSAWGNTRVDARTLEADETTIEGEAAVWDLERNIAVRIATKVQITDRKGVRYKEHQIITSGKAARSLALRDAIFKIIPRVRVRTVYEECLKAAVGDIKSLVERRTAAIDYWARFGINQERVLQRLEKKSVEEVTLDDCGKLRALAEQINNEDITIDEAFPKERPNTEAGADGLADRLKKPAEQPPDATPIGKVAKDAVAGAEAAAEDTPEAAERRRQALELRIETALKKHKCSPGKKGCGDAGTTWKGQYICETHDPRNS